MVRAVLFDLDDTLFDHRGGARLALEAVQGHHACFSRIPFADFSRAHGQLLETLHTDVLAGRITIDDARRERFRRLFAIAGVQASAPVIESAAVAYRDRYLGARRAVDGAVALLQLVRPLARVGIVSNNLHQEQMEKIRSCGLETFVDVLVVSETAGVAKPDPAIFRLALDRLECAPSAAVMVGDSWPADIEGAQRAGIRPIWFNPLGSAAPDPGIVQLRSLEPADRVLRVLWGQTGV